MLVFMIMKVESGVWALVCVASRSYDLELIPLFPKGAFVQSPAVLFTLAGVSS
jgi:hypothetical protein